MSATPLILVRHAPTDWTGRRYCGRSDPPLHAAGEIEARALAGRLAGAGVAALAPRILASPRRRATATAAAIAAVIGGSVTVDERWEEVDFGIAEGRTFAELRDIEPSLAARLEAGDVAIDWPGGETAASLEIRVRVAIADLAALGRPTIVVSHAGPLRVALAALTERAPRDVAVPAPGEAIRVDLVAAPPAAGKR